MTAASFWQFYVHDAAGDVQAICKRGIDAGLVVRYGLGEGATVRVGHGARTIYTEEGDTKALGQEQFGAMLEAKAEALLREIEEAAAHDAEMTAQSEAAADAEARARYEEGR